MESADVLRLLIILLALTAPVLIVIRNHSKRHHINWGDVLIRMGIGMTFLAVAYSTAEAYIQGLAGATRLYVLVVALIWVNVGLLVSIHHDRKLSKMEKAKEATPWI